ncbi:hypothetical protein F383_33931 [Gossypium arboreum]|uniref:Uncharacterized protein n=1 Tax=Gossypium arboreum TaxID=29729 RepID=A0A0B0PNF2_GOSAR|nr:hypothetical protein F383_33931 [Gossypium arboreum]
MCCRKDLAWKGIC